MNMEQMFEGISAGTPMCEIRSLDDKPCIWASSVRLSSECKSCGHTTVSFFCPRHKRGLVAGEVICYHCKSPDVRVKES